MLNVRPAMLAVPVRAGPLFAATPSVAEPVPRDVAPALTTIQGTLLPLVHEQLSAVETLTITFTPAALTISLLRSMTYSHGIAPVAWAACVIVTV